MKSFQSKGQLELNEIIEEKCLTCVWIPYYMESMEWNME